MKKSLLVCALAIAVTGCVEHQPDRYVPAYRPAPVQYAPACGCAQQVTQQVNTCTTCQQTMPTQSCCGCTTHRPEPKPKTVVIMVPSAPAPQPQPVIEHEIVLQTQPACGCKKCGCHAGTK